MTTPRTKPASSESDLLARLGLPSGASSQDVETAHDELVAYLEKAPAELRPWARNQIATVDEAFAILSDPTIDRSPKVAVAAVAESVPTAVAASVATTEVDEIEELELDHPATRHGRREVERQARAAARSGSAKQRPGIGRSGLVRRLAIGGAVVVGALAVGFIGFNMNGGTRVPGFNGSPAPEASAAGVDQAQVAALMQKIAADPKDAKSLQSIGDLYYEVGDYADGRRPGSTRSSRSTRRTPTRGWPWAPRCTTRATPSRPRSSGARSSPSIRRTSRPTTTSGSST